MTIDRLTPSSYFCGSNIEFVDITNSQLNKVDSVRDILSSQEIDFLVLEEMIHQQLGCHDVSSESHSFRTSQNSYEAFVQIDPHFAKTLDPDDIKMGGLLHDIGKLCVDENILTKPSALTIEEVEKIKLHPYFSYRMLYDIPGLNRTVLDIALYHHEKWDGSGYPCGFKGEEIPLEARIFSVVDVWDALISKRPYREAIPHEDALRMMMGDKFAGHFDPRVLSAFVRFKRFLLRSA